MEFVNEFDIGESYFLETEKRASMFEALGALTKKRPGFCITSEDPSSLKKKYGLDGIKFAHLTTSRDRTSIRPKELDLLGLTIKKFVSEEGGIVLLDGIDYLVEKNDISGVIRLIKSVEDRIKGGESAFLIHLDTSNMREEDLKLLKTNLDFDVKKINDTFKQPKKTLDADKSEHLVSQVRSMMEFLKEQEKYIEKEENKIDLEKPSGLSDYQKFESLKEEIETLREQNRELKNELERIKTEGQEEEKEEIFGEEIADEVAATVKEEKKDIEEHMEKIEDKEEKEVQQQIRQPALMGTLRKLEEEVGSLREEVKTLKKESPRRTFNEGRLEEYIREESKKYEDIGSESPSDIETGEDSEETEKIASERPSDIEAERDFKESDIASSETDKEDEHDKEEIEVIDSERPSDPRVEDEEVIQEPKLEDEYKTREKEITEESEQEPIEENKNDEVDEDIICDEDKILLRSDSKISKDIESEGTIEIQKDVRLNGTLKSEGDIIISGNNTIQGEIISRSGDVKVGKDCKISGKIHGMSISISERSKVEDIEAKKDVILEENTRVRNIASEEDVKIFENVEIDGDIDYGGQLDLNGDYINIRGRIRPMSEEIGKERWV